MVNILLCQTLCFFESSQKAHILGQNSLVGICSAEILDDQEKPVDTDIQ